MQDPKSGAPKYTVDRNEEAHNLDPKSGPRNLDLHPEIKLSSSENRTKSFIDPKVGAITQLFR